MQTLYFEDFEPGRRFKTAGKTVSEAEILEFALKYDPQPFHMDAEAAKATIYGGLIASGVQTLGLTLRLAVQHGILSETSLGSPGIEELRWLKPVRPGDTLHAEVEVLEARPSQSKPDRGVVLFKWDCINQAGELVMTFRSPQMVKARGKA